MKTDRVMFTKTFQVGISQWEKCGLEASLDDSDDPVECLDKLKQEVEAFHRGSNPQLYKNGNEALVTEFWHEGLTSHAVTKTINRKYDEMKDTINECKSLEELATHKEYCGRNPDLMPFYMNKLKELTGGIKI